MRAASNFGGALRSMALATLPLHPPEHLPKVVIIDEPDKEAVTRRRLASLTPAEKRFFL
ncbi:MAG: hypothetical protein LBG43_05155 [Treponema sp.]|nr:hypothetical protein [Treponema sp.]